MVRPSRLARLACAELDSNSVSGPIPKKKRAELRLYWDRSPLVLPFFAAPLAILAGVMLFHTVPNADGWTFLLTWLVCTPFVLRWVWLLRRRLVVIERARCRSSDRAPHRMKEWRRRSNFNGPGALLAAGARQFGLQVWPVAILWPAVGAAGFLAESSAYLTGAGLGAFDSIEELLAVALLGGLTWAFVLGVWHYRSIARLGRRMGSGGCLECGYDLRGLERDDQPVSPCPECGIAYPTLPPPMPREVRAEMTRVEHE